jgi:hypothetical protein
MEQILKIGKYTANYNKSKNGYGIACKDQKIGYVNIIGLVIFSNGNYLITINDLNDLATISRICSRNFEKIKGN